MPRYALLIEYDGSPFAGWQRQDGLPTVQGAVETALGKLEPGPHAIAAAGRTDTGVHASGQVAMGETAKDWEPFRLSEALNFHLKPAPVAVLRAAYAPEGWHPRFDAVERRYEYRIASRRAPLTLAGGRMWHVRQRLDAEAMQEGARHLVGRHDFTTFRSVQCQSKTPVKTLDELTVEARPMPGGTEVVLRLRARSFLHNQVRSIAGTLERVGAGGWPPDRVREALEARDRAACGPVAPPDGLYLTGVRYPVDPFASHC